MGAVGDVGGDGRGAGVLRRALGGVDAGPPGRAAGGGAATRSPPERRARWRSSRRRCAAVRPTVRRWRSRRRAALSVAGSARRSSTRRPASPSWRATPRRPRSTEAAARKLDPDRNPTSRRGPARPVCARPPSADRRRRGNHRSANRTGKAAETTDLDQILAALPAGSALAQAVGRWAAARARRRGDPAGALALLTSLGATTAAAARDRLDLEVLAGGRARSTRAWRACVGSPGRRRPRPTCSGSKPAISFVAASTRRRPRCWRGGSKSTPMPFRWRCWPRRLRRPPTIRRWRRRRWISGCGAIRPGAPEAALALAAILEATGSGLNARAALQTAVESAPESASFWIAAASDARAGRRSDAAAALGFGAEVWEASSLVPALRAAAAVKLAPSDPARALAALGEVGERVAVRRGARAGTVGRGAAGRAGRGSGGVRGGARGRGGRHARSGASGLAGAPARFVDSFGRERGGRRSARAIARAGARGRCSSSAGAGALSRRAGGRGGSGGGGHGPGRFGLSRDLGVQPDDGVGRGEHARAQRRLRGGAAVRDGDPGGSAGRSGGAFGGGADGRGARRRARPARAGRAAGRAGGARRGPVAGGRRGAHRGRRVGARPARRCESWATAGSGPTRGARVRGSICRRGAFPAASSSPRRWIKRPPNRELRWRRSSTPRPPAAGTSWSPRWRALRRTRRWRAPARWPSRRWSPRGTATMRQPTGWPRRRSGRTRQRRRCRPWRGSPARTPTRRSARAR